MANKPFFVPQKEINLFDSMNEELIDEIVGQTVDIYKISIENTEENLYGESSTKYYNDGFRVNCLINWSEPTVESDEFGADVKNAKEFWTDMYKQLQSDLQIMQDCTKTECDYCGVYK